MSEELPSELNSITVSLTPIAETQPSSVPSLSGLVQTAEGVYSAVPYDPSKLDYQKSAKAAPEFQTDKTILSLDVETTGTNPWEYRLIVCSVWDLNEPKANMVTFASWDEEQLTKDLFEYIASKDPDIILAFNAKFENRCFVSRSMQFRIPAPWIWSAEWHDLMYILEGGWKNGLQGSQPTGSEENWLMYFFGETKPYTIDECFEGIRQGRLDEMIIRNRTCVAGQGDIYQLYLYSRYGLQEEIPEEKPTVTRIEEWMAEGKVLVKCSVCGAVNEVFDPNNPGQCWRCLANLPAPSPENIVREAVRPVDWGAVGYTAKELAAAQKAGTYQPVTELQPVAPEAPQVTAMQRLIRLGVEPHVSE